MHLKNYANFAWAEELVIHVDHWGITPEIRVATNMVTIDATINAMIRNSDTEYETHLIDDQMSQDLYRHGIKRTSVKIIHGVNHSEVFPMKCCL